MTTSRAGPPPDAFAVVMATGILAAGAGVHGYRPLAVGLACVAAVAFAGLTGWIALAGPDGDGWRRETRDPDVVLRAFTFVAAATVLATAVRQLGGPAWVMDVLAAVALVAWSGLLPLAVRDVVRTRPRDLRVRVHGAWLLVSVGTSGLATVAADLGARASSPLLVGVSATLWLLALVLYGLVMALVVWRLTLGRPDPSAVTPDMWILMGALAIGALAGDHLQAALAAIGAGPGPVGAAHGLTVVVQVAALAWVPVLLAVEVWDVRNAPGTLTYATGWWAAVFPLGMLAASSAATARTWPLPALETVSLVVFWDAVALWAVVAVGLGRFALGITPRVRRP